MNLEGFYHDLPEQYHLLYIVKLARIDLIVVDSARQITCIPFHLMITGILSFHNQYRYLCPSRL